MKARSGFWLIVFTLLLTGCSKDPFLAADNGIFVDARDKHEYKWVRIGKQVWMAENLAYLPTISNSETGSVYDKDYHIYDYVGSDMIEAKATSNYTRYGVLYNWQSSLTVCPLEWHLPSDEEWKTLEKFLGMSQEEASSTWFRSSGDVGKKLKSNSGWAEEGNGDNSTGFNALSGGYCFGGGYFEELGDVAGFWTATSIDLLFAWSRKLDYSSHGLLRDAFRKDIGFSVRCLKD